MIIFSRIPIKSITVLLGTVMLLSCKNDMKDVAAIAGEDQLLPVMSGVNMTLTYSDSARIQYKVATPEMLQFDSEKNKYKEFPKGIHVTSFEKDGTEQGTVDSKYAKNTEEDMLWELRNQVVVISGEKKLETELLYWDTKKGIIYTDRYVRLTDKGNVIEGNNGLVSDQNLENPIIKNTSGEVEFEMKKQ